MSDEQKNLGGTLPRVGPRTPLDEDTAQRILRAVSSLKYGSVEVTVHDGRVVQIDRRERVRLDNGRAR